MRLLDLTGKVFERLTVLERHPVNTKSSGGARWVCQCECGNITVVAGNDLRKGTTKSCGCWHKDNPYTKHGHVVDGKLSPEYEAWLGMKRRCSYPGATGYKYYGGRGIKVCFNSFESFFADVGPRTSPEHSIDRINVNGNYEPGNVRWSTRSEQQQNKRPFKRK
jgi:hypothetical protein